MLAASAQDGFSSGCGGTAPPVGAAALATLGDQHGELECLLVVQPRIDARAVGTRKVRVGESAGAAGALGNIIARQLDVHTAEVGAHVGVNAERKIELAQD